ncbi:MAG: hypothetical protein DRI87_06150 [Bacteroidetes bacterium]|nr:MAG: hypothetical protein DRI87_06150 [Bacteroidota bacterium]
MWFRFLRGSGYYGSMNDMMYQFWCVDGGSTTDFALNIDFTTEPVVDKVSGMSMDATALAALLAGRPKDMTSGDLAIAGEATLNSQGLLTYGSYTNLIPWSEDMTGNTWLPSNATITPTTFQATLQNGRVGFLVATLDSVLYTVSFRAKVASGDAPYSTAALRHTNSPAGNNTPVTLTDVYQTFQVTVLGMVGGGNVQFGIQDNAAADWAEITVTDFQVTETTSIMPYVKTEATAVVVPNNYSNTGIGYQWDMGVGGVNMPDLWAAWAGAPAQGELQIEWTPHYDSDIVTENKAIAGVKSSTSDTVRYNAQLKMILDDGTLTVSSDAIPWVAGTKYTIYAIWGTHPVEGANRMQVGVTDGTTVWESAIEVFDGSFDPTQFFKFSWINYFPQIIKSAKMLKTPMSGTWFSEPPTRTEIDFFTQGAAISPTLAGTADVEWHWADGSVTTGNDPGVQDMSLTDGNNYLSIFDPENVTQLDFSDITDLTLDVDDMLLMPNLVGVYLSDTEATGDISGYSALTSLTQLQMQNTGVTGDISGYSALTSIKHLQMQNTGVTGDISGYSALTSISSLRLNGTGVTGDISGFSALVEATYLRMENSGVTGAIADWSGYTRLEDLQCQSSGVLAADADIMVADMWTNRVMLGANPLTTNISTTAPVTADSRDRIEGLGTYAGDGLVQAGCVVTYTAPV